MNAYELANTILKTTDMQVYAQSVTKATNMLRQQADRIAELEKEADRLSSHANELRKIHANRIAELESKL